MKKKHLSQIILNRLLRTIAGSFMALMVVTVIFIRLYAMSRTESLIRFSLDECDGIATNRMQATQDMILPGAADSVDQIISEMGVEYLTDPEFVEYIEGDGLANKCEESIIGPDGIVVASSAPENVGFDIRSGEQSAQFMSILNGETDIIIQDFMERSVDGKVMRYGGALIPKYGGIYVEGHTREEFNEQKQRFLISQIRFDRIESTGYYLLADKDDIIISSPQGQYNGEKLSLSEDIDKRAENGRIIKEIMFGRSSYVGVRTEGDDHVVAVFPSSVAWRSWNFSMSILMVIYVLVFVTLYFLINRLIARHMVKAVYSIDGSLKKITEGDLEEKADFRKSIEFATLSDGINYMVDRMKGLIKEADERIDAELDFAAKIQLSFLPHDFPPFPDRNEFELYAAMVPAKEVGGDLYDYFLIDDDHLAIAVGDVSGKGIPAAMFMVMAKDKIRHSVMKYGTDVASAVEEVNDELAKENDEMMFVTIWLGVLDLKTGHVDYVNAGHEYPAIYKAGEGFTECEGIHGPMAAAMAGMKYTAGSFELAPGDILYQYTDGFTEATDPDDNMFTIERLLDALNADTDASVEEIDKNARAAIAEFVRTAPQFDDMTSVALRYKGVQ